MPIQIIIFLTKTKLFACEINSNGKAESISIKGNTEIKCEGKKSADELIACLFDAFYIDGFADDSFDIVIIESDADREVVKHLETKCAGAFKFNIISMEKILPVIASSKNIIKSGEDVFVTFSDEFFKISCNENNIVKIDKARKCEEAIALNENDFTCLFYFIADELSDLPEENRFDDKEIKETLEIAEKAYLEGRHKEAFLLFLDLAAKDNGRAMYFLGEYYKCGIARRLVSQSIQEIIGFVWDRLGAQKGDALAGLNVAYSYPEDSIEKEQIINKYFGLVKELADSGDIVAQDEVACVYLNGLGIENNINKAIEYLKKAASCGNWKSAHVLGDIYSVGRRVPQDFNEAVMWYRRAAEQGYDISQYLLGTMYHTGYGVAQDYGEAMKWYHKAAEQGYDGAQFGLGIMFQYGEGMKQDYNEAIKWYRKAAEQGNEDAIEKLKTLGICI